MAGAKAGERRDSRDEPLPHVALLTLIGGVVVLAVIAATLVLWEGRVVVLLLSSPTPSEPQCDRESSALCEWVSHERSGLLGTS